MIENEYSDWHPMPCSSWENRSEYVRSIEQFLSDVPEKTVEKEDRGFVYIAVSTDKVRCKIGWSLTPERRIRSLPYFRLVHYFPGDRRIERALHQKFAAHAIGHERFRLEGDLLEFVSSLRKLVA